VFENRVLRRIFGPKREEVAGGWRRLQLLCFTKYYEGDQIKDDEIRLVGHAVRMREKKLYTLLMKYTQNVSDEEASENMTFSRPVTVYYICSDACNSVSGQDKLIGFRRRNRKQIQRKMERSEESRRKRNGETCKEREGNKERGKGNKKQRHLEWKRNRDENKEQKNSNYGSLFLFHHILLRVTSVWITQSPSSSST
jgi:hypothetical protein